MKVCFDVDGTLIDYTNQPRDLVIHLLRTFKALGCEVYVWSGGGVQYAHGWVNRLGLNDVVDDVIMKGSIKPDLAVDDQSVNLGLANFRTNPLDMLEDKDMLDVLED